MSDINLPDSPSGGDTYTFNNITYTYDGEKWTAQAPLSTTGTYGNANVASYVSSQGLIDLTDISVATATPSGNGSLSYSNVSGVFTFTPADASGSGGGTNQTLTLNSTAGQLAISDGNNVDLRQTQYLYSSTSDLPSASTYHGAIGHVHAEGALYFAHGGSWVKLANDSDAVSSSSETTFTADVNFDTGVSEKFSSLTGATGVVTHDCDNGHIFYHTSISADFTANFTNLGLDANYSTAITLILNQGVTPRVVSAVQIGGSAQTINWQGGSAPTGTANGLDAFSFTILRDGSSYIVLGQMVDFT